MHGSIESRPEEASLVESVLKLNEADAFARPLAKLHGGLATFE
jgi:hypothetical protein